MDNTTERVDKAEPKVTDAHIVVNPNPITVEVSHRELDVKWIIPTFEDLKQCSNEELCNIAAFSILSGSANKTEDFLYFANRMLPERFKVNNPVKRE